MLLLHLSCRESLTVEAKGEMPLSNANTFKALVMPQNNGKIVMAILKRRAWWKT